MGTSRHTPARVAFRRPWPGTVRGRILWFFAVIIGLKGLGYVFGNPSASADQSMMLLTQWLPLHFWGGVVFVVCFVAAVFSYCHYGRDHHGYDLLTGLCGAWAAVYLASMLLGAPLYALQGALSLALIGGALIFLRRLRDVRDEAIRRMPS